MPKVSIITINYNNLEGLKRTIDSVVHQTWQEFEYIIIDGGSTDGSAAYIESQSAHFDYWVSEPDKGIYNAMNKGIAKATGEYLLFLNSGDHLYDLKVLEQNHKHIAGYDLVYFNMHILGKNVSKIITYPNDLQFSHLFFSSLPHQATFFRNKLFQTVGLYDEKLKIASDWKFIIIALFIHKCSYMHVNNTLSTFYLDGISSKVDYSLERQGVLKEYFHQYFLDYNEFLFLKEQNKILETNRFKMLLEIERNFFGKKFFSYLFRIYILLTSKRKLKDVLQ